MSLNPGTRLGPYEIVAAIGAGGMGEVYKARDTRLDRDVAIKILPEAFAADADRVARFQREAKTLAALNHPNIAQIFGLEQAGDVHALAMEFVAGEDLSERIARGPILIEEALPIAKQIAEALEAAHEQGIIHRDLKPANIKVRPDGNVKVLDFGLAKAMDPPASSPNVSQSPTITSPAMTRAGMILGTAAYMSPEQAKGRTVDKRTDVWAFGCVLFEMLTARRCFNGQDVTDTIVSILSKEPDWDALPTATPTTIRGLLRRCLRKDVKQRLRDIGDARIEIDERQSTNDVSDSTKTRRTSRWLTASLTTAAAAVAFLLGAYWHTAFRSAPQLTSAMGPHYSHVTWDDSFSTEPAISPDGTLVVYASDRGGEGQLDLWLQRTLGGQPVRLTNDPADDRAPAFSPDGSLIAFQSMRNGGGIYVMPTLGGDARLVAPAGRNPRFSPDGKTIVYWTGPWLGGPRTPGSTLFVVPSNGGTAVRISEGFAAAVNPIWDPDGHRVLFFGNPSTGAAGQGFDWWITSLETHTAMPTGAYALLQAKALRGSTVNNSVLPAPDALPSAWTTEGVVFSAQFEQSVNLWRVKIDEASGQAVGSSLERLTNGAGADVFASVDDRGRIVFKVESLTRESLLLPLDANAGKPLGPIQRLSSDLALVDGRNSLDDEGRLLVYPKLRPTESEIWLKDIHAGRERHLVTTPVSQLNPTISPDGTMVAYTVPEGDSIAGYVIATAGGTPRRVCVPCNLQGWLHDGRVVVVNAGAGAGNPGSIPGRARVVDVSNGAEHVAITDPQAGIGRVDFSPDARWIAFQSRGHLWLAPFNLGTEPDESRWTSILTVARGSAERACGWSPNGQLLYLLLERDGFRDLWAQRIDTAHGTSSGDPFLVQHLHDPKRTWGSTPYGTAIVNGAFVFTQSAVTGGIWIRDPAQTR